MPTSQPVETVEDRSALLDDFVREIREFFAANADPNIVAKYSRYFREGYDAYGVADSIQGPKRDEWFARYRDALGLDGFLDLGDRLWESGMYEEGNLAVNLVSRLKSEFTPETFDRLGRWIDIGVHNWAHSDILSDLMQEFLKRRIVNLDALGPWRYSEFRFKRRAVPVIMLCLLKLSPDYAPLLDFLRPLMLDPERVVQQGMGWFLREAWKLKPDPTEAFLLEWKDSAPRLIYQYATEKMRPEAKARFRRAK